MAAASLAREREWSDAIGERVAYAPDGRAWACSSRQLLQLFEDDEPAATTSAPGELLSELEFSRDGTRVLVAPRAYDRAAADWAPRAAVEDALATGLDPGAAEGFAAVAGAWAPDGSALAIYGEYRPPRGLPARAGTDGPSARLVL